MRVYCDIAGDLFHYGHASFFKTLKNNGANYVIVGLHSDDDIHNYKNKRPILSLTERKSIIETCKYVDEVWVNTPVYLTKKYLIENNIEQVSHAHDKNDKTYDGYYKVPIEMGIFKRLDYNNGISTSEIIQRILKAYQK